MSKQKVSLIAQDLPVTVNTQDTVKKIEDVLDEDGLTSVPVVDPERNECFGIISLIDNHHFHAQKKNPNTIKAWEICTYKPLTVSQDTLIENAGKLMVEHGIHHLVVIKKKKIRGFVSSLDVIKFYLSK